MSQVVSAPRTAAHSAADTTTGGTRALLACGAVAGPLFVATVVIQEYTRAGFDPRRHPLSLLSLDDLGWIQITNFIVAGVLVVASAVGLRRALNLGRAGRWGPRLIATYGVGLICGGVFLPDPLDGYPRGTPAGGPAQFSWHGILHGVAPAVAGLALIAACVVFARRFAGQGQRGWTAYTVATVLANIALTGVTFAVSDYRVMFLGGVLIWLCASAVTGHVLRGTSR